MALPLDTRVPDAELKRAREALARAKAVGEEYEGVEVATAVVRARSAGEAIVREAKRRGVEAIVLAAEEPVAHARRRAVRRQAGPARHVRGRDDALRGQQGPLPRDPHRAAREAALPTTPLAAATATRRAGRRAAATADPDAEPRSPRRSLESRADVRPRGRSGPGRLLRGDLGAARRSHRLGARRGPALARAARRRARPVVGGGRRALHDRHGARDRRADRGGDRGGATCSSPPRTATTPTSWSRRSPSAASRSRA